MNAHTLLRLLQAASSRTLDRPVRVVVWHGDGSWRVLEIDEVAWDPGATTNTHDEDDEGGWAVHVTLKLPPPEGIPLRAHLEVKAEAAANDEKRCISCGVRASKLCEECAADGLAVRPGGT